MVTNWIFVYVIVVITPYGIENLAWRFYIIFAVLNFAWFPIIYFFYIETKGLSLEEIDLMFKIKHNSDTNTTYKQAAQMAKEQIELVRIAGSATEKTDVPSSEMREHVRS